MLPYQWILSVSPVRTLSSPSALVAIFLLSGCASGKKEIANPWSLVRNASAGRCASIGSYSAGCLRGAASLPPDGPGYQVMRIGRGRFYAHPELIEFIQTLGRRAARQKLGPLLVGDMSMARGGPTLSGHRSHQTGLDVDLWFWRPTGQYARSLTLAERESLPAPSVLASDRAQLNRVYWLSGAETLLEAAAGFENVERIFVTPLVKKSLCGRLPSNKRAWLSKIRPWYGHDDHFHVRLKCPESSPLCHAQEPAPAGDECGAELDWWFSEEARVKTKAFADEKPSAMPILPDECRAVLDE